MFYAAVHFWAPTFKWGISIANLADSSKPPEKVSYPQQIAVTATGVIWSRYSTVITPANKRAFKEVYGKKEVHMADSMNVEIGHVNRNLSEQSEYRHLPANAKNSVSTIISMTTKLLWPKNEHNWGQIHPLRFRFIIIPGSDPILIYIRRFFHQHLVGKGIMVMKVHRAVIASGARYRNYCLTFSFSISINGEHKLYVELCAALCEERITWREDGVTLIRSKENLNDHH
ncbi:hypothetical protein SASPL_144701 [Salvia splendens]|uniref:Mitochondrial pyruvate carrier n=1 Tax=Salvia splendens TaxID=180675 RepID=A0A8X8Z6Q2_SALSN|nr:hypothetical protein SASPL_144701 [Salvia splendens]